MTADTILMPEVAARVAAGMTRVPVGFKFTLAEIANPAIVDAYGAETVHAFPQAVIDGLHALREAWGRGLVVNSRRTGAVNSGLRASDCPVGAKRSGHKLGLSFDFHFLSSQVRNEFARFVVEKGPSFGVTRMESLEATPSWVHVEFAACESSKVSAVRVFKP